MSRIMLTKGNLLYLIKQYKYERASHFVDADSCKPKQIQNAIKSYAPDVKPEDVVALLDRTVFGGAKDGFLLTRTHLYGDMFKGKSVEVNNIQNIKRDGGSLTIRYLDDREEQLQLHDFASDLYNFLTLVTAASRELQKIAPKRGEELLEQGAEAFWKKDYRAAEKAFREAAYFGNAQAKTYLRQLLAWDK